MRFKRGTIFILLFVVISAGIVGASQLLQRQPPLEFTIAADPLIAAWAQEAASAFNATNPVVGAARRAQIRITTANDLSVWLSREWSGASHPDAWIPAASAAVTYAADSGLTFTTVTNSLARSPLMWGGFASRVDVLAAGKPLDWPQVAAAAQQESWAALGGSPGWGFVKLAFNQPRTRFSGLAALLSGAAAFSQKTSLSANELTASQFRDWMQPVLRSVNFNTLGADPAQTMAGPAGASAAEIALLPEAQWLTSFSGLRAKEAIRFSYPEYGFVLDFPLARWQDAQTTPEAQQAIQAFAAWLTAPARQAALTGYGLRPALADPTQSDRLFADAQASGVILNNPVSKLVQPPATGRDIQALLGVLN